MRNFRLLKADEIECRINQITEKGIGILLYKTARTDYALLDETVGMMNWQNQYTVIDGKMYCGIAIKDEKTGNWVWKYNCGVESNTEAEKGQASDAMKRAGFCWGIGTELYSAPFIWIPADKCNIKKREKDGKLMCFDSFRVSDISYDDTETISALVIKDARGNVAFAFGKNKRGSAPAATDVVRRENTQEEPQSPPEPVFVPKCKDCGAEITEKVHDYSVKKFGAPYCMTCQKNHNANR